MVLFSLSFYLFLSLSRSHSYTLTKVRKVSAGQKEDFCTQSAKSSVDIQHAKLLYYYFNYEMSLKPIAGFNIAGRFKWQGGVQAFVCVHMCIRVCIQIDTFVLFVLQIPSQHHGHFGSRIVKDKHVIESRGCEEDSEGEKLSRRAFCLPISQPLI